MDTNTTTRRKGNLSKSKLISSLQCPKRLWLETYRKDLIEVPAAMQQAFDTGNQVGDIARQLYGAGIFISPENDLASALQETTAAIEQATGCPLYEATFSAGGVLVRVDILLPDEGGYQIVEVKSSTSVKDVYLRDCAIQAWVAKKAGLDIKRVSLAHIDNTFVYPGAGRYEGLLKEVEVTEQIAPLLGLVEGWVANGKAVMQGEEPQIEMGRQCHSPYDCPFISYCKPQDQPEYPVSILPHGAKLIGQLQEAGYMDLRDVPAELLTKDNHIKVWRVTKSGNPELDPRAAHAISEWSYPRYYFDFETISFAVPKWAGTRPYEQLPFQWSCHIESESGEVRHEGFLGSGFEAPMRACAEKLIEVLGIDGTVVAYNAGFERGVLKNLAAAYPDLNEPLQGIIRRIVDLLPVTRSYYYAPSMMGSWSIKKVLPALVPELNYAALDEVQDGQGAQLAFLELMDKNVSSERKRRIHKNLWEYCKLDTWAMKKIADQFAIQS